MNVFLRNLFTAPGTATVLLLTSCIISILALTPSFMVIITLDKYLASGVFSTLVSLITFGVIGVLFEFAFRTNRDAIIKRFLIKESSYLLEGLKTKVAKENKIPRTLGEQYQAIKNTNKSPQLFGTLLDAPFIPIFLAVLFYISFNLTIILLLFLIIASMLYIARPLTQMSESTAQNFDIGIIGLLIVCIIGYGSFLTVNGELAVGALIGFNILGTRVYQAFTKLFKVSNPLAMRYRSFALVEEYLRSK